jgi:polyhydroxybutyrate depolymerase
VGFLSALIGELIQKVGADPKAIFMAGVSNGGFMIQRFASLQGRTLAGAAVVAASLPAYLPKAPIGAVPKHWLFLHGVYDPIVPLEGSAGLRGIRLAPAGGFLSAEATFQFWADQSGCTPEVFSDRLPGADGSSVLCKARASQKGDALCLQYIFAGGHVWPGFPLGPLGERWLGPSCMAFDAGSLIWQFFQKVVAQHRPSV